MGRPFSPDEAAQVFEEIQKLRASDPSLSQRAVARRLSISQPSAAKYWSAPPPDPAAEPVVRSSRAAIRSGRNVRATRRRREPVVRTLPSPSRHESLSNDVGREMRAIGVDLRELRESMESWRAAQEGVPYESVQEKGRAARGESFLAEIADHVESEAKLAGVSMTEATRNLIDNTARLVSRRLPSWEAGDRSLVEENPSVRPDGARGDLNSELQSGPDPRAPIEGGTSALSQALTSPEFMDGLAKRIADAVVARMDPQVRDVLGEEAAKLGVVLRFFERLEVGLERAGLAPLEQSTWREQLALRGPMVHREALTKLLKLIPTPSQDRPSAKFNSDRPSVFVSGAEPPSVGVRS